MFAANAFRRGTRLNADVFFRRFLWPSMSYPSVREFFRRAYLIRERIVSRRLAGRTPKHLPKTEIGGISVGPFCKVVK